MASSTKTVTLFRRRKNVLAITTKSLSSQALPQIISTANKDLSINEMVSSRFGLIARSPSLKPISSPLSILPLSAIVRSLAITSVSCSPVLLNPSINIIAAIAHAKSPLLSPDSNPVLKHLLKKTFYRQFCAGENESEVRPAVAQLKSLGFKGVILGYAKEVVVEDSQVQNLASCGDSEAAKACIENEIKPWANGTLETVKMTSPGDFVGVKVTGAGSQARYALSRQSEPSPAVKEAIDSVCDLAASRGVRLLFDAEQAALQPSIDAWTLTYMRKYNKKGTGKAMIYGTYQAYLKACSSVLASHMATARKENFTLGVKLVRGAYLGVDPRYLIHDTKADTDAAHDGIAESLVTNSYGTILRPAKGEDEKVFPSVNVVLAGHNRASVRKVQAIRTAQAERGEPQVDLVYAQLQGMADEVSCELVQCGKACDDSKKVDVPQAYKYFVWGTTGECLKFLLRRAQENKDALQRTRDTRDAMASELLRRMKKAFGMGA